MTTISDIYLTNLADTCRRDNSVIDEGGKQRPWYLAVVQIFREKQKTQYFTESCKTLKRAVDQGEISTLSLQDKFDILFRIETISTKLSGDAKCETEIQAFKNHILTKDEQELKDFATRIVERLMPGTDSYRSDNHSIQQDLKILKVIFDHYNANGKEEDIKHLYSLTARISFLKGTGTHSFSAYQPLEKFFVEEFRDMALRNPKDHMHAYHVVFMKYLGNLEGKKEKKYRKEFIEQAELHNDIMSQAMDKIAHGELENIGIFKAELESIAKRSKRDFNRLKHLKRFALKGESDSLTCSPEIGPYKIRGLCKLLTTKRNTSHEKKIFGRTNNKCSQ